MTIVSRAINKLRATFNRNYTNQVLCFADGREINPVQPSFPIQAAVTSEALTNLDLPSHFMDFAMQRLNNGTELIYCCEDETLIAYGWRTKNVNRFYVYEIAGDIVFDKPVDVLYDFVVLPQYRNRGIYKSMLRFLLSTRTVGRHSVIYADSDNAASLKVIRVCGFQEVGKVSHFSRRCTIKSE